jgi:hypothetical protein
MICVREDFDGGAKLQADPATKYVIAHNINGAEYRKEKVK